MKVPRYAGAKKGLRALALLGTVVLAVIAVAFSVFALNNDNGAAQEGGTFVATPAPSYADRPFALWVGDSFTEGTGAGGPSRGYPAIVSAAMGWYPIIDAQGGTGFVADGKKNVVTYVPVAERLMRTTVTPQIVVVDAGRNDGGYDFRSQTAPAVRSYLDDVRSRWPNAQIVLIVPYFVSSTNPFANFMTLFEEEATRINAVVIDPLTDGWVTPQTTGRMIYRDGIHPDAGGHDFIARNLIERFKRLGVGVAS